MTRFIIILAALAALTVSAEAAKQKTSNKTKHANVSDIHFTHVSDKSTP
ncbi:MAG: hypothetical protein KGO53_06935 [Alphaproteobacteria bacterium]|nr:hypothetical protein [Alphaproteobacteria bacterium]